jgi:hypothetical protein
VQAAPRFTYRLPVLGRYSARLKGNEPAVTFNVAAGTEGHVTYAGTLTMTDDEYQTFVGALRQVLGDAVTVNEH